MVGTTTESIERTKGDLAKANLADLIDPLNPMTLEEVLRRGWDYRNYLDALGRARAKWNLTYSEKARHAAEAERERLENERIAADSRWVSLYDGVAVSCAACGHGITLFRSDPDFGRTDPVEFRAFQEGENNQTCIAWRCPSCGARGVLSLGHVLLETPPRQWIGLSIIRKKLGEAKRAHGSIFRRGKSE